MKSTRKLWTWLAVICVMSFAVLGWVGSEIYLSAPPIPSTIASTEGVVVFEPGQVMRGQQAWLAAGGQQLGTVWGHGSYLAPDWSADWLHREALALREIRAERAFHLSYAQLGAADRAALDTGIRDTMRTNGYQPDTGKIVLDPDRAQAVKEVARHYLSLFGDDPKLNALREQYAMQTAAIVNQGDLQVGGGGPPRQAWLVLHQQLAA